jgi:FtsP/CotA-like multicopper oxidase with cupredoxin domain
MGRFGTVMLVNGDTQPTYDVSHGEVIRLYLVNTANTRIFNVAIRGARMKLVGGDSGRCEHEEFVDSVMLSPSERAVVEVLFDQPGDTFFEHHPPGSSAPLATFQVGDQAAVPSFAAQFEKLRTHNELVVERKGLLPWRDRAADKTLLFVGEMDMSGMGHDMGHDMGGMQHDMTHEMSPHGGGQTDDGIEWEDTMPEMNVMSDRSNMHWKLIDTDTGAVNHEIFWTFRVGDRVKLRLDNTAGSDHEMHHPFHIHGAGRFLVLDRGGVEEANLVWKDTVLVRAGEVVNILFDASNPGRWMAHCHIAEHTESGMMFSFDVVSGVAP